MNKIRGKVLSLVLAAALVVSSFPATFASASTHHTVKGDLSNTDNDKIYLVNGGKTDAQLSYTEFNNYVASDPVLKTEEHESASDVKVAAISHKSGDRLVKWFDGSSDPAVDNGSIDDDTTDITLKLRSSTVSGHEVLNILYKGTWTDDDDNEYTVKATKTFDVYVYDKNACVIGLASKDGAKNDKGELDDDFAQKTVDHEINSGDQDSKKLTVLKAVPSGDGCLVQWKLLKTISDKDANAKQYLKSDDTTNTDVFYVMKSSSENVGLTAGSIDKYDYTVSSAAGAKGTSTYSISSVTAAGDTAPAIAQNGDDSTKLDVTPASSDSSSTWVYYYAIGDSTLTEATKDDTHKLSTLTKAIDLTKVTTTGQKVAVTAYDGEIKEGSTVVTVTVTAAKYTDADCATVAEGTSDAKKVALNVTKASSDSSESWTYYYKVGADVTKADKSSDTKIDSFTNKVAALSLPCTSNTKVAISAYDGDTLKSTAIVTVNAAPHTVGDGEACLEATVADKATTGSVTFTAEATTYAKGRTYNEGDSEDQRISSNKDVKATAKVKKELLVGANDSFCHFLKHSGSTYLTANTSLSNEDVKSGSHVAIKVNGYEVNFDGSATVTVDDKASVTKLSGDVDSITVSSGSVGTIDIGDGDVSVDGTNAKTGDISVDTAKKITVSSKAQVGNIDVDDDDTDCVVEIDSGKVGTVTAPVVNVKADEDDSTTTVGDIKAVTVSLDSEDSKVVVGTLTAKDTDSEFTLQGNQITVKGFDFDYYNTNLKFDDFQGVISAPVKANKDGATITTTNGDDRVEVVGDVDIDGINVEDDSTITFDGKVNATNIDGSGIMDVSAGKLYVDGEVSGTVLKLADPSLTKGMTVLSALSDCVEPEDFECYGFTLDKTSGSKSDTFKIASVEFKGLSIDKSTSEIAKDHSEIFTASAYPGGTTIPAGYTVKWDLEDANDSIFELTDNKNNTATVKVIGYDSDFASENKCTLKAQLLDASGDEVDEDEYAAGECALTAVAVPAQTFISDTTGNKAMKLGETYQFAITSTDGTKPSFAVASAGAAVSYAGASGNKYFFKVKAAKVGSYGVYAGGTRVAILVISSDVTLDTSKVTVKAGSSYQFEATAPKQPTFQVAGIGTIALRSHSGSNYYFKVTVPSKTAKGGHGVYVNGVRMAVLTVA